VHKKSSPLDPYYNHVHG